MNDTHVHRKDDGTVIVHRDPYVSEGTYLVSRVIYYIFGALETLLAFRLILKILGANPVSGFVSFIYNLSNPFVAPFSGIFRRAVAPGIETSAVFEPATLVAMIVYALIAWAIIKLVTLPSEAHEVHTEEEHYHEHTHAHI